VLDGTVAKKVVKEYLNGVIFRPTVEFETPPRVVGGVLSFLGFAH
jgi:hypothetical protein